LLTWEVEAIVVAYVNPAFLKTAEKEYGILEEYGLTREMSTENLEGARID
jgi:hypothetical protein